MKITFFGATDGVTGSNYLLEIDNERILVECGLFQGTKQEEVKNWENFPYDPKQITAVILTHSHLDHIGLIPKLVKNGFNGKIYSTPATKDFAKIFLTDSKNILAKFAERENKPLLYDDVDIEKTISLFETIDYHTKKKISPNISFIFYDAGHILGSAFIKINIKNKSIVFSGDLGNPPVPIIKDTEFIKNADYVIMESTYGNTIHSSGEKRIDDLENIIEEIYSKKGTLLIPAFAMERTQELLYEINYLISNNKIPKINVYIDSPLAQKANLVYPKYKKDFDQESKLLLSQNKDLFSFPELKLTTSVEESKAIDEDKKTKIIIAGSGMSTGGRIIYHEKKYLPDSNSILLLVGFQVKGTLGRKIQDGEKIVNIFGQQIKVNAKIVTLNSYSAHADQSKLIWWLNEMGTKQIKQVFLIHGEELQKQALKIKIQDELGINVKIPKNNEEVVL